MRIRTTTIRQLDKEILNWVHNKLNGKQHKKTLNNPVNFSSSFHYDRKEEFSDWPQALLAIGTFGTNGFKENQERCSSSEGDSKEDDTLTIDSSKNSASSSLELLDFTVDDASNLQKELTKLYTLQPKSSKLDGSNLPLNRFLNCPLSLELDTVAYDHDHNHDHLSNINAEEESYLSPKSKIILSKARDILTDNRKGIKRRSIKFLLMKLFACQRGLPPIPNVRDTVPESKVEKILRMMLHKKTYPQSSTPTTSVKKYLNKKPSEKRCKPRDEHEEGEDEDQQQQQQGQEEEEEEEGSKWVKTDSEFIVLEI
ncbi:protein NEGATIVE GRAVITROPIC RESPONSE OF ROOTS isoform X3 [Dioscorea cayenensis subsp. rotundata]|uniref:Protein NEGATIVE GRAVITROPIC RESPONSE OF ROOTS isoform X3 n=1 Tax=Dioscorea cayennensis subsp. rotundata TaxID=55577 RepID=A0AB40BBL2_DIOCR|nr:protein NEGATIVE GRAVITROPIC RESPONSE OF ROOTS isoform X3 [Dioscorea cayenensis subsp. rotundata]XP_039124348.1 protein NEGATIVE GRAVITROPIC RESPONSE OF ROOTS isoform X3 [Dioscorea cayenensis subsp. rotundata]